MDTRLSSMALASSMALVGKRLDAGRGADGSLLVRAADDTSRTFAEVAASQEAEIVAAHNVIYDNHNPLRCAEVIDLVNANPKLTHADVLAISAMLIATVLAQTMQTARASALGGVGMMAKAMVLQHDVAAAVTPPAGINPV